MTGGTRWGDVMNETIHPDRPSDVASPSSDPRVRMPDTSMLPGSEKAAPAAVGLLNTAIQGAHHTIERLADSAAPAVRQLGESVSADGEALHAKTDQYSYLHIAQPDREAYELALGEYFDSSPADVKIGLNVLN